jgi:Glutathione S-transferase
MITVHHLENSRSQRILWLLEELGVEYRVQRYARDAKTMLAPPELQRVHPLGKSPVIDDDGRVVAESGAIVEYLIERFGEGRLRPPPGSEQMLDYRYWLHYAEGSLMPLLVLKLICSQVAPATPWPVRPVARAIVAGVGRGYLDPNLARHLAQVDAVLEGREWFAGALSGADVQMIFPLEAAVARAGGNFPRIRDYVARVHARPAWKRALDAGGPYTLPG